MNIIFFANGIFALNALESLVKSKHNILTVITNEDKISGRGRKYQPTPIAKFSTENNLNLSKINFINDVKHVNYLKSFNADIFVIISYKILNKIIYSIPKYKSINIHASLLPNYRGAAPIQRSIMNGDNILGLTSFKLNSKIDSGDIIHQKKVKITDTTTYGEAHDLLSDLSGIFLLDTLQKIENKIIYKHQLDKKNNYATKILKEEYKISLNAKSQNIHNSIRSLTPPGSYLIFNSKRVKIFDTYYKNVNIYKLNIGHFIIKEHILIIGCKYGHLTCKSLQFEGKKRTNINDFKNMNYNSQAIFE